MSSPANGLCIPGIFNGLQSTRLSMTCYDRHFEHPAWIKVLARSYRFLELPWPPISLTQWCCQCWGHNGSHNKSVLSWIDSTAGSWTKDHDEQVCCSQVPKPNTTISPSMLSQMRWEHLVWKWRMLVSFQAPGTTKNHRYEVKKLQAPN